ncbi:Similar to Q3MB33_ANAVT Peptidase C14 (fragment) [Hyella patelloides LEGE 07179]|uniref:Similar to Q3MB33_ANAVT Peptidase C14 n=1 Tax=Hyella patelloides LEGE 07179 TaxID=945734 RepID=A0A563W021_9CYAN
MTGMQSNASNVLMMEDPAVGLTPGSREEVRLEKRTLHVFWSKCEAKLFYTIYSPHSSEAGDWNKEISDQSNIETEIENFWSELSDILGDTITIGNPPNQIWQDIDSTLKSFGQRLFKNLVPDQVAKRIKDWRSGFSVRVSTNEQWIPWELMHDGEGFLGDKFIFSRYPRLGDRRTDPNENRQKHQGLREVRKIVNVVGGNIDESEAIGAFKLFDRLSESIILERLREKSFSELIRASALADILHFTCHGHLQPLNLLQISSSKSRIRDLSIDKVQQLLFKPGCFVFANACNSTVPVQAALFDGFRSFGWEFYRQGADVFIGTLGIVPTKYAIDFAENVYVELLCKDTKMTVGQAIAHAKKIAAEQHNFFWLLYCIYGNPDVYFEPIE